MTPARESLPDWHEAFRKYEEKLRGTEGLSPAFVWHDAWYHAIEACKAALAQPVEGETCVWRRSRNPNISLTGCREWIADPHYKFCPDCGLKVERKLT